MLPYSRKSNKIEFAQFFFHLLPLGILRYLGGRFPETTSAVDENGRTALHYAATIKDNGHFYNMLLQMGANPKAIDKVVVNYVFFFIFLLDGTNG